MLSAITRSGILSSATGDTSFLQRDTEEPRSIKAMDRRPAVLRIRDIRRDSPLLPDVGYWVSPAVLAAACDLRSQRYARFDPSGQNENS
jgi:hypothetical protein